MPGKTKKVLIIDDNPQVQNMIKVFLEEEECQIITLSDGQFGPQIYRNNKIDLRHDYAIFRWN